MALPASQHRPEDEIGGEVRWTPEAHAALEALAVARGISVPDMVSEAIDLMLWFDEVLADGGSVVTRPKRGPWEIVRARR